MKRDERGRFVSYKGAMWQQGGTEEDNKELADLMSRKEELLRRVARLNLHIEACKQRMRRTVRQIKADLNDTKAKRMS